MSHAPLKIIRCHVSVRDIVGKEMGIDGEVPLLQVDASDPASLQSMVDKTKVVLTTVGNTLFSSPKPTSAVISCFPLLPCTLSSRPISTLRQ